MTNSSLDRVALPFSSDRGWWVNPYSRWPPTKNLEEASKIILSVREGVPTDRFPATEDGISGNYPLFTVGASFFLESFPVMQSRLL